MNAVRAETLISYFLSAMAPILDHFGEPRKRAI
jgi:hypothetical protein